MTRQQEAQAALDALQRGDYSKAKTLFAKEYEEGMEQTRESVKRLKQIAELENFGSPAHIMALKNLSRATWSPKHIWDDVVRWAKGKP